MQDKQSITDKEKEAYAERLQAEIDSWNADINKLRAKAKLASADVQQKYYEEIEQIEERRDALEARFNELKAANAGAWDDLRQGVERAWQDMSKAMKNAASRFQ